MKPKLKKTLLWAFGVVAVLIVVGLVTVLLMLNGIVRSTVEKQATSSLKTTTTLQAASVAPFSGALRLDGLEINSPDGFKAPKIFTLGKVGVDVRYNQLFGDPVKVAAIVIDKPKLVIEQAGGKLNVMALMDNLKSPEPTTKDPSAKPMKLIINQLDVTDAQVEIRPGIPGVKESYGVTLPSISMSNIGNAEGAQTGEEIGRIVNDLIAVMTKRAMESDQIPEEVRRVLSLDVNALRDQVETRVRQEFDKGKDKINNEIKKGLGDLLKKNEKK